MFVSSAKSKSCTFTQIRSFSLGNVSYKQALFELHLRRQAMELDISPKQSPPVLRDAVTVAHKKILGDLGSDVNITLVEMRKRRRIAELLETAKSLSDAGLISPASGDLSFDQIKESVFEYYKNELTKNGLPVRGNLRVLQKRLSNVRS